MLYSCQTTRELLQSSFNHGFHLPAFSLIYLRKLLFALEAHNQLTPKSIHHSSKAAAQSNSIPPLQPYFGIQFRASTSQSPPQPAANQIRSPHHLIPSLHPAITAATQIKFLQGSIITASFKSTQSPHSAASTSQLQTLQFQFITLNYHSPYPAWFPPLPSFPAPYRLPKPDAASSQSSPCLSSSCCLRRSQPWAQPVLSPAVMLLPCSSPCAALCSHISPSTAQAASSAKEKEKKN